MRNRFASRKFNYDFPEELVSAAGDEELCSWQTRQEGEVTITVHVREQPPPDARFLGVLRLQTDDELLVLPYSQYTMACSYRKREPEKIEGLCACLKVDSGRYACWGCFAHANGPLERVTEAPLAFNVYMPTAGAADRPLGEVPTLER
jgi:hypothetical protein